MMFRILPGEYDGQEQGKRVDSFHRKLIIMMEHRINPLKDQSEDMKQVRDRLDGLLESGH